MPENFPEPRCPHFGPFELDPRSGELRKHGLRVRLAEQPFRLLEFLIEHAGEVVTRDELRRHLWPQDTFVDFDNGLNAAVNRVREALADSAERPRYIETLPKKGYRFIASVEVVPSDLHTAPPQASKPTLSNAKTAQRRILWAAVSLGIAVLSILGVWARHALMPAHTARFKGRVMLAVLPFADLSGDSSQEYFSDGLTEEMTTQLGGVDPERMGVIARTSALQYKGTHKDTRQIGQDLNVDYLVEGSVRREGRHVRITAQLIRVRDGTHVWAHSYDSDLRDFLVLQSEVAGDIAEQIELKLGGRGPVRLATGRPIDYEAHRSYLLGRYFWNLRTEGGYLKAIEYFEQALKKDPDYGQAYSGLADAYALLGSNPTTSISRPEAMAKARAAAGKALALDETLAEAHTSLAFVHWHYDWDWPAAEKEFRRALELNPSYATAHHWYAYYLMSQGRTDEALEEIHRAQETDPLSLIINTDAAQMLYFAQHYDQAIKQAKRVLEMDPDFTLAQVILAWSYLAKNENRAAVEEAKRGMQVPGAKPYMQANLAMTYAVTGQKDKAQDLLLQLKLAAERLHTEGLSTGIAQVYAALGENDQAFAWLEKDLQNRDGGLTLIKVAPFFDSLHGDPRFADLVRRIGLPP